MIRRHFIIVFFILLAMSFTIYDCVIINLPVASFNYANITFPLDILNNLSQMDNMPVSNPTTDAGATLGRVLFYDVDLSQNNTISCASCHRQEFSFADTSRFSTGFNGGMTSRNSMGLIHARFQRDGQFFWDNRASSLEVQTLMPIQNNIEMGLTLDQLVSRVSAKSYYPPLFASAFGSPVVSSDNIAKALAQFIRSMNTFGSRFRYGVDITTGNPSIVPFPNFTAQENLGKNLFMDKDRGNCQACHTRNIVVQQGAQNIGLNVVYTDNGVGAATGNPNKNGLFSVPSLINIGLTAPYMHDGRFSTLEKVIDFYSDSIQPHPNLSHFLIDTLTGLPRRPHYTFTEKQALKAFLLTLTDTVLTTDVRWSNPFTQNNQLMVTSNNDSGEGSLRSLLQCAAQGDTIRFAVNVDTIYLNSPLSLDKDIALKDEYGSPVVIKADFGLSGFSSVGYGIHISSGTNVNCRNIHFRHINNSILTPIILNEGILIFNNCTLDGNIASVVNNLAGSILTLKGTNYFH